MPNLRVVYLNAADLIPYSNNSRIHTESQVLQVAASIKEFGFTNPILVDGTGSIIAGHGRLLAAKKLGLKQVPTIILDGLTEAQKKAYVIADNQIAINADWDLNLLQVEVERLAELNFDIDLLGFSDDFISGLSEALDFSDKNTEIDVDDFDDLMELKFKLSAEDFGAVSEALRKINESKEVAILQVLGL